MITRPLLASAVEEKDLWQLRYPLFISEKLDGVRCLIHPEKGAVTRSFKPIPNEHVAEVLSSERFNGFDGELTLAEDAEFHQITSSIMSFDGRPNFTFHVFDDFSAPKDPFLSRYEGLVQRMRELPEEDHSYIQLHIQYKCSDSKEVVTRYEEFAAKGAEGIIIRSPTAVYKSGRSTLREQILLKLKPIHDAEAKIVGFLPLQSNQNKAEKDLFGLTERSGAKGGLVTMDTLGSLVVESKEYGKFNIGTGFSQSMRDHIWRNQSSFLGELVTFTYQKIGIKNKPRFPSFLRMRNVIAFRRKYESS